MDLISSSVALQSLQYDLFVQGNDWRVQEWDLFLYDTGVLVDVLLLKVDLK